MNVLIIGLGSIGKKHVDAIKSLVNNSKIYALRSNCNINQYLDVINIYDLKCIPTLSLDFIIISNPTSEHRKTIEEIIEYNLPVFIEKPIDSNLKIASLIKRIEEKKLMTYVACNLRFLDCISYVKDYLNSKQTSILNEVNVYCGSYLPDWRPNVDYRKVYSAIPELGGGVHLDLIHELDYLYWFFGIPKKVNRIFRSQSSLTIFSHDYANFVLEYDGFCSNVILNYYRKEPKRSLELVFEKETWEIDLLKNKIMSNNRIIFLSNQRIPDTYILQMEYFIKCVKFKSETFNTMMNAFDVLKICIEK